MIGSMGAAVWLGVLLLLARGGAGAGQPRILRPGLRRRVIFWVGLAIFSALALLGARFPLNLLLYHVPVFNLFRVQNRWMVFIDLALAMLAAVGIDRTLGRGLRLQFMQGLKPELRSRAEARSKKRRPETHLLKPGARKSRLEAG